MKCKSDPSHIWRWFAMRLQSGFYRWVSVWTFWPLKSNFKVSFASLTTRHTHRRGQIQSDGSASEWLSRSRAVLFGGMENNNTGDLDKRWNVWRARWWISIWILSHATLESCVTSVHSDDFGVTTATHADRLVKSGHTNPIQSLGLNIHCKSICLLCRAFGFKSVSTR